MSGNSFEEENELFKLEALKNGQRKQLALRNTHNSNLQQGQWKKNSHHLKRPGQEKMKECLLQTLGESMSVGRSHDAVVLRWINAFSCVYREKLCPFKHTIDPSKAFMTTRIGTEGITLYSDYIRGDPAALIRHTSQGGRC